MIFVLMALATARVTRLITSDVLFESVRMWAINTVLGGAHAPGENRVRANLQYLITCDWCASVYVGAGMAGAWYAWGETMAFTAVCAALAASYATGYLNTRAGD